MTTTTNITSTTGSVTPFDPEAAAARAAPRGFPPHGPAAGRVVAVRRGSALATSFHPEVTGDRRIHSLFAEMVRAHA